MIKPTGQLEKVVPFVIINPWQIRIAEIIEETAEAVEITAKAEEVVAAEAAAVEVAEAVGRGRTRQAAEEGSGSKDAMQ